MKPSPILSGLLLLLAATSSHGQITKIPATVKPGRFLLEMDALSLTLDQQPGFKYTALGVASTFLSTGLTENWDIQLGADELLSLWVRDEYGCQTKCRVEADISREVHDSSINLALFPGISLPPGQRVSAPDFLHF